MQTKSSEKKEIISEINIVPFVDVVLVILIIFLLISPTFINPGFDIQLPRAETAKKPKNIRALLSIDIEGKVFFNKKSVNKKQLIKSLKKMIARDKDIKIVIAADRNVSHGNVIALIDLVKKSGVNKFAVSVEASK